MENRLLTAEDVADLLGVTPQTLAVWRSTGRYDLLFVKVGRLVRYRRTDVDSFAQRRTRQHTGATG
jgi:excisionase family DNA binding protein